MLSDLCSESTQQILQEFSEVMTNKIKISKISSQCFQQKGFDERSCFGCGCNDSCCKFGADFDKESYDLVVAHRELIEPLIARRIEDCFDQCFSNDEEFLGANSIRSVIGETGFCSFHNRTGKGCVLYQLVYANGITRRILPSICKLFPLSWRKGELLYYTEIGDDNMPALPADCNCADAGNQTLRTILLTQANEINDLFEIDAGCKDFFDHFSKTVN